jgi:hypothetical protein
MLFCRAVAAYRKTNQATRQELNVFNDLDKTVGYQTNFDY